MTGAGSGPGCGCTARRGSGRRRRSRSTRPRCCCRPRSEPYRVPAWSARRRSQRDFHVRAQNAFYSVPYGLIGQQVTVRADDALVKVYHRGQVVKTHPQQPAGGRSSDPADFPPGTDVYARRDVDRLASDGRRERRGDRHLRGPDPGHRPALDEDAGRLRADRPLPAPTGTAPVEQACAAALELDVISVAKIRSIVEKGTGAQAAQAAARARQADAAAGKVTGGAVRPRSPRVRHRDRRPHAGPARRRIPHAADRRRIPISIQLHRARFVSFVSFHFVPPCARHARERTRSHDDHRAAGGRADGREAGNMPVSGMREPGQGQGPRRAGPAARLLRAGDPRGPRRHQRCWSGTPR